MKKSFLFAVATSFIAMVLLLFATGCSDITDSNKDSLQVQPQEETTQEEATEDANSRLFSISTTSITVTNSSGTQKTYSSVQSALNACTGSSSYIITLPKGTYKENGLYYTGSATIRLTGLGSATYGTDVVIKGHGSNMTKMGRPGGTKGRELLEVAGSANLILENISLVSDWERSGHTDLSNFQAEVLGFNSTGTLAAYNCNFYSHQDTIRTTGKAWFYKCQVSGDVDFIWMENRDNATVALYESCKIVALLQERDAFVCAPGLSGTQSVGKGVVLWKSTISTSGSSKKAYLFRNPWGANGGKYNQAAVIASTVLGFAPSLTQSSSSDPVKHSDGTAIGWKIDATLANSYSSRAKNIAVLKDTTEYSSRDKILNRLFNRSTNAYENSSPKWDTKPISQYWTSGKNLPSTTDLSTPSTSSGTTSSSSTTSNVTNKTYDFVGLSSVSGVTIPTGSSESTVNFKAGSKVTVNGATIYGGTKDGNLRLRGKGGKSTAINFNGGLKTDITSSCGSISSLDRYISIPGPINERVQVNYKVIAATSGKTGSKNALVGLFDATGKALYVKKVDTTYGATNDSGFQATISTSSTPVYLVFSRSADSNVNTGGLDVYSIKTGTAIASTSASTSGSTSSGGSSSGSTSTTGTIKANDKPIGYAGVGGSYVTSGATKTVSTRADFLQAVKQGGIIYVSGTIDITNSGQGSMLPTSAGGSTSALDNFVKSNTSGKYTTYAAFKKAYAASCSISSNHKSSSSTEGLSGTLWALNAAYGKVVKVNIPSKTTIIGLAGATIKGGVFNISSASNVIIRNINFKDAYDPFPHHEKNDGFNAEQDCICIQGTSSNIWLDHCTFEDTMYTSNVSISGGASEKWQTYDGLCDMKGSIKNITISACKFQNHDKTMLIGNSDTDGNNSTRTISLIGNYFYNCGQRLPMARNTKLHIVNNYYEASSPHYTQQYAIGCRAGSIIYIENNYFGSGIQYSVKDDKNNAGGTYYLVGNSDNSSKKTNISKSTKASSAPFAPAYSYTALSASSAKTSAINNAGSGKWSVAK